MRWGKGKRGERLWASFCREQGYDVHRTAQYRGNTGAAGDVEGLPYIHCEVKYVQALNIAKAMEQSESDAKATFKERLHSKQTGMITNAEVHFEPDLVILPIVASKRTKEPWLVTMNALDWISMAGLVEDLEHVHTVFKRRNRSTIRKELEEAREQYRRGEIIVLRYVRGGLSLVTMYAEDWFTIYREWEAGMDLKRRQES